MIELSGPEGFRTKRVYDAMTQAKREPFYSDKEPFDWTEYGVPAREWTDFVAAHPEEDVTAELPDKPAAELQRDVNAKREEKSHRNSSAHHLESEVHVEEVEMHTTGDGPQDKLTVRKYTRVSQEDELKLDKLPGVVYYHGGGYVFGTPDTEGYLCSLVASKLRVVVLHICYREAPQHPHPAGHHDGKVGFEWVVENADRLRIDPEQIVLVGLSCGAGIAASTALRVCNEDAERLEEEESSPRAGKRRKTNDEDSPRSAQSWKETVLGSPELKTSDDCPPEEKVFDRSAPLAGRSKQKARIKGMLLAVPWLLQEDSFPYHRFASREATSRVQCAEAPGMSKDVYDCLVDMLKAEDPKDPLLNVPVASEEELERFPRTAFMITGMDFFRDDGLLLAHRLGSLGVPRRVHMFKGMPHGFRKYDDLWSSKRFDELFLLLINWALDRTVSSIDTGFHVEQRELVNPTEKKSRESRMQKPPFTTRFRGKKESM